MKHAETSLTGQYLSGVKCIEIPARHRATNGQNLRIVGAREKNLKGLDVTIPLGLLVAVTDVSGSGKSSLINAILYKRLHQVFRDRRIIPGEHDRIEGLEYLTDVRNIDHSLIGRSSRSTPATYVGVYDKIRKLFAGLPKSQARGYGDHRFSFNNIKKQTLLNVPA